VFACVRACVFVCVYVWPVYHPLLGVSADYTDVWPRCNQSHARCVAPTERRSLSRARLHLETKLPLLIHLRHQQHLHRPPIHHPLPSTPPPTLLQPCQRVFTACIPPSPPTIRPSCDRHLPAQPTVPVPVPVPVSVCPHIPTHASSLW